MYQPISEQAQAAFDALPSDPRQVLLSVRGLIFDTAETAIEETVKCGQPSYRAVGSKHGTPIRLGVAKSGQPALFTHCQTSVISDFRSAFPADFTYEGNRALVLDDLSKSDLLKAFIKSALTYPKR